MLSNNKGQALFEFIAFMPFLLMLYSVTLTISNSLNASINQQKTTRSYFFYINQNDSRFPSADRNSAQPFSQFSMSIIGWAKEFEGQVPVAPCFELKAPIGDIEGDECAAAYSEDKTQFIRVGTVFGICGASYLKQGQSTLILPFRNAGDDAILSVKDPIGACSLTE